MKLFLKYMLVIGLASHAFAAVKQPNVVFFLVDDLGWKDLGCFGAELYETPNIDQLCSEGIRFPQAYSSAAICSPARATALTGKHCLNLNMWSHQHTIPQGQKILPHYLKEAGYQTWHVGKWHLGNEKKKTMPTDLGFDVNIGGWTAWGPGSYFWPYNWKPNGKSPSRTSVPMLKEGGKEGEQLTDRLTQEALSLIDQRDPDKPFYLNFWYYSVHNKKEAKPELIKKYEQKIADMGLVETVRHDPKTGAKFITSETNPLYAAMIETLDDSVGRVIAKLKEIGEYENTLFVFFSDNGSTTNDVPCAPLNGGKNSTYEAGVRIPGFVVWNGEIKPGTEYEGAVFIGDIFNTIMAATGQEIPTDHPTDSVSLLPVFAGETLSPREFYWYFPDSRKHWGQRANAAIFDEKNGMKYIMFFTGEEDELYDIRADIGETTNLMGHYPEVSQVLQKKLIKFMNSHYGSLPTPPKKYKEGVMKRLNANDNGS
ncbi:sulfatase [Coraliomargarita algicola]|uniref:Sulfatase n=1 Tax=Coraliomargarita algicola TaxID=3092156 RepID=A0ABZ0RME8_9BACT|nr:sulfatase [Coraliomargarita sp. J2-16]WPJ95945.1 sulfatase [Coraliomargarita sp. J2-16]